MNWPALANDCAIVLLALVALGALTVILWTLRNGVPPMPSSKRVRASLIALLGPLHLPQHGVFVELGSGWGGVSLALSRAVPEATVIGYENSPLPFLFSIVLGRLFRADNLRFVRTDFHRAPLRDADAVVCYLSPSAMSRLQPKLVSELRASAVVLSITFALPVWKASRVAIANDLYRSRIYVYHAGACRANASGRHVNIIDSPAGGS